MRKFTSLLCFLLSLVLSVSASRRFLAPESEEWNYFEQGRDWTGTCATGMEQSPIDIQTGFAVCDDSLLLDLYVAGGVKTFPIIDTGETIKATTNVSNEYAVNDEGVLTGYESLQFHFHAPSEHTIDGKHYDLEMHFVHNVTDDYTTSRNLSVLGIFFEIDDNAPENLFIDALDLEKVTTTGINVTVNLKTRLFDRLPKPVSYYAYEGSLTTPTCDEIVNWYVITTPLKIRTSQLAVITSKYAGNYEFAEGNGNNRETQPLNGRVVKLGGVTCDFETGDDINLMP